MIKIDTRKLIRILCAGALCSLPAHSPAQETNAADTKLEFIDFSSGPAINIPVETREVEGVERITIVLDDVSLEDTVRMFAQTTSANIIASVAQLRDKQVSVNLQDVEWKPALRSILDIHGFELAEQTPGSGIYAIQVKAPDAPEPTEVRTFFLNFANTGEVEGPIRSVLGGSAGLTLYPSRNALVIRASASKLAETEKLLSELDRPGKQVLIETRIMELSDEAAKQLGIRWDSLEAFSVRGGLGPFTESRSSVDSVQRSSSRQTESTQERSSLDTSSRFTDVGRVDETGFGSTGGSTDSAETRSTINFPGTSTFLNDELAQRNNVSTSTRDLSSRNNSGSESQSSRLSSSLDRASSTTDIINNFTRDIIKSQSAILEMDAFELVLSALERTDGVSVVSNPKMIVASGNTNAFFFVGESEPIISTTLTRGTPESPGDTLVAELDTEIETDFIRGGYLETGIRLQVITTVKTDDYIEADINPTLRRFVENKTVGVNSWPVISERQIQTTFTLKSGQTVAIGGLTNTEDLKETSGIPILGSLPIIGRLFSHTRDVKRQVETIIFVTLSIADPAALHQAAGIPQGARLVHNRLIQEEAEIATRAGISEEISGPELDIEHEANKPVPR